MSISVLLGSSKEIRSGESNKKFNVNKKYFLIQKYNCRLIKLKFTFVKTVQY